MKTGMLTFLLVPALVAMADTSRGTVTNLFANPDGWKTWVQRPEVAPAFDMQKPAGSGAAPALIIDSRGDRDAFGCWLHPLPTLRKGRTYRVEAAFEPQGIDRVDRRVWAMISNGEGQFQELNHEGGNTAVRRMSIEFTPDKDYDGLALRLYLAWAPGGSVRWREARVTDIGAESDQKRLVKLAAVAGRPTQGSTPAQALDFYLKRIDEAGAQRVDLVCLPELVNTDRVALEPPGDRTNLAEQLPGGSFYSALAAKAREHRMYIAACLLERDGRRIYNSGVIIGRDGQLVGKYRKTHPTVQESLLKGNTPGDEYPVFDTDIGRVGYMICFDNHQPEVSRALAIQGAEIIVFSNDSDGRERGTLYEAYMQTRALDNQVHIVASVNKAGQTLIVTPRGEIVARAAKEPGALAIATCDLSAGVRDGSGREIEGRYMRVRRADTFAPLLREYSERRPDVSSSISR